MRGLLLVVCLGLCACANVKRVSAPAAPVLPVASVAPDVWSPEKKREPKTMLRELAAQAWVCEVEANSKIFTGVGASQQAAVHSAQSTCGSHFQASYCHHAECRQNL